MQKTSIHKSALGFILEYKYVVLIGFYAFWMMFLDNNNLMSIYKLNREIENYEQEKQFYEGEIEAIGHQKHLMENDIETNIAYGKKNMIVSSELEDVFYIERRKTSIKR